ncbi:MAG: NDP-sugar synthase [Thermoanaerobaculia bacterium]
MPRLRLRALVLAAGRGERLRPLTAELPKPLLPVAGRPLLAWTLERLRAAGCEAVAINLHHLGHQIRDAFGDRFRGMPLVYSEEPELLGTSGALPPLRPFLEQADQVLVVNGDSLCRWPIEKLVAMHLRRRPAATLLVHRKADPRAFGGGVALEDDAITAFRPGSLADASARRHLVFAGAQVLAPELLARIPEGPGDLVSVLYEPLLAEGAALAALATERLWHDLGTPQRYLDGVLDWTFRGSNRAARVVKGAEVDPSARLRRTIVEAGAHVDAEADLRCCVVMPGAKIGKGVVLKRSVVGPGATVAAGTETDTTLFSFDPASGETTPARIAR